jgi:hypothetical protein
VREAISALESAVGSLEQARDGLPEDLKAELAKIVDQARIVLASLRAKAPDETR